MQAAFDIFSWFLGLIVITAIATWIDFEFSLFDWNPHFDTGSVVSIVWGFMTVIGIIAFATRRRRRFTNLSFVLISSLFLFIPFDLYRKNSHAVVQGQTQYQPSLVTSALAGMTGIFYGDRFLKAETNNTETEQTSKANDLAEVAIHNSLFSAFVISAMNDYTDQFDQLFARTTPAPLYYSIFVWSLFVLPFLTALHFAIWPRRPLSKTEILNE